MGLVSAIALALGASWAAGIRLYASVATLGLLSRFNLVELPGNLGVLENPYVIGVAGVLFVAEFLADKIPIFDSIWDVIHTFIRIPAGAVMAAAAFADFAPGVQFAALLIGGGVALSSHGTKATTRAAVNTSPEPFSNVAVSAVEDVVSVGGVLMAVFVPIVAIAVIVTLVILSLILVPRLIRTLKKVVKRGSDATSGITS
ncbi:MAG: DUF4126 domain-containing protein [Armatimonadota bacterium]|nr:DUF4126 domain-containing protein [Armatimonadota bacterium]